jgi:hypothetical protein
MIKHNKKRNVGILYEALVFAVTEHASNNNISDASKLFAILKNHFMNPLSEINKAYGMYSQLLYNESSNVYYAKTMLGYLLKEDKNVDYSRLDKEIKKLIEDVRKVTDVKKMMSKKIPNYKLFASFCSILEHHKKSISLKPIERSKCETLVLEHFQNNKEIKMLNKPEKQLDESHRLDELATVVALKMMKERYNRTLTVEQQEVLTKYLTSPSEKAFARWSERKLAQLEKLVEEKKSTLSSDNLKLKIETVIERLQPIKGSQKLTTEQLTDFILSLEMKEAIKLF